VAAFNSSAIIRHMTTLDRSYVLYNDVPQRRYRQIQAKSQESPYHLQFFVEIWEGTVLQVRPSDTENTVRHQERGDCQGGRRT
jgi:hypothetical protein